MLLVTLLLVACRGGSSDDGRVALSIVDAKGARSVLHVEVAQTPAELESGLSNRSSLGKDDGMLFVIAQRGAGFWMKDTLIPLTVAFVAPCGQIVALADMQPQTLDLHDTPLDYHFGIEANLGWYAQHSIAVGDKVALPASLQQPGC